MSQTPTIDNALLKLLPDSSHPGPTIRVNPSEVELLRGSEVRLEPISWLWDGWLASGKTHILAGAPGTGKTTISLALAAAITCEGRWPDGSTAPLGNVVIWSGEDDPADTLAPRLVAAGADLKRVYFVTGVLENNERRSFDPGIDMPALDRAFMQIAGKVSLIIVDPIVSAVTGDSNKNAETRRCLQPLVDLAAARGCALLGISHFAKNTGGRDPIDRLNGSIAFAAMPRVVMVAAKSKDPEEGNTTRLLLRAKSNIGPDSGGFKYDFIQTELKERLGIFTSSIIWGDSIQGATRDILAEVEGEDGVESGTFKEVLNWLEQLLIDESGEVDRRDVMKAAHAMGFKDRTVYRAREKLGIMVNQTGFGKDKRSVWKYENGTHVCQTDPILPTDFVGKYDELGKIEREEVQKFESPPDVHPIEPFHLDDIADPLKTRPKVRFNRGWPNEG